MDATATGLAPHPSAAPASPCHGNAALSATPHPAPFSPIPLFILQSKSALKGSHFIPTKAGHSSILNQRPSPALGLYKKGEPPPSFRAPLPTILLLTPCSSTTTASSPPSPGHHTAARALVRPEIDSLCSPLSVAMSPRSCRDPERPLGQALVSYSVSHGHDSPWTSTANGP
jgi:hypothetical protein